MNEKERAAFDRVANRIKEQSERVNKPISIDEARRELSKHLTEADNRKRR